MKNNTQSPTLNKIIQVRDDFRKVYDENLRIKKSGKNIYNKRVIDKLNKELEEIGISQDLTPKEQEITLEKWFELLSNPQETLTEVPRPERLNNTTLTSDQLENLGEFAERRDAALKQSREKAVSDVANTQTRLKEIYDQQRIIQEQIKEVQELQPKFVGKKVYATVEQQEFIASLEAQKSFETLTEYANYQETRTDLVDQLTESVKSKTNTEEIVARTIVVQLVNDISDNELAKEKIREVAIEEAIEQNKNKVLEQVLQKDETLIETAKKGAVLEAENMKGSVFLTREIAENILPLEVVEQIYGPKQIKVVLSSVPNEQTTHEVDFEKSIRKYKINLEEQSKFLDNLKEGGIDGAKNIFRNQLYSNVNTYLAKAPKGSALGKIYSSDAVKAILTQGSPSALELKYFGKNPLLQTYFKYSPESMPYFKMFTEVTGVSVGVGVASKVIPLTYGGGAIPLAKIAFIQPVKSLVVPYTLGVKTGAKFAVGKAAGQVAGQVAAKTGITAAVASLGIPIPGVNIIIGAVVWLGSELLSKAKVWWQKNKEKVKPVLAVGVTIAAIRFLGVGPGLAVGGVATFGLMGRAGLASIATGAFGVLGLIGRSTLITISTPVIVTLLVFPPLVAFIMLVINNSAYIVPPSPYSSSQNSGTDNPYMLVTKTANPTKLDNSNSNQTVIYVVTVKALKGNLTNVNITGSECTVTKKDNSNPPDCPPEIFPEITNDSISPNEPHTFSFTGIYDSKYADSLIFDSITFTATAEDGTEVTTSGSASVCIGDCPHGCFEISNDNETWKPNYSSTLAGAVAELTAKFPNFVDKACNGASTIKLCYTTKNPSPIGDGLCVNNIYAIHAHNSNGCDINFNQCAVDGSTEDAFFLLTHELSHHIQKIDGGDMVSRHQNSGATNELPLCTYSGTIKNGVKNPYEGSAEANALYANGGTSSFSTCSTNFQSQYPRNYNYARDYMNNP